MKKATPKTAKKQTRKPRKKQDKKQVRKTKLARKAKLAKWAPVWVVLKKHGMGKRVHPSSMTRHRRSWRRTKLHIKPRRQKKSHFA